MGRFLNPDYSAFETALNSEIYIDKTGLLAYTNKVINTKQAFICNSRPRRFWKVCHSGYAYSLLQQRLRFSRYICRL